MVVPLPLHRDGFFNRIKIAVVTLRNDKTHEIANARNAMTKYLKLRSYFVVLFAQNVHGAMILIFEIAKAKNTIFAIAKSTRTQR